MRYETLLVVSYLVGCTLSCGGVNVLLLCFVDVVVVIWWRGACGRVHMLVWTGGCYDGMDLELLRVVWCYSWFDDPDPGGGAVWCTRGGMVHAFWFGVAVVWWTWW